LRKLSGGEGGDGSRGTGGPLELKTISANLAVDGAESLLAKEMTPQVQESLVAGVCEEP